MHRVPATGAVLAAHSPAPRGQSPPRSSPLTRPAVPPLSLLPAPSHPTEVSVGLQPPCVLAAPRGPRPLVCSSSPGLGDGSAHSRRSAQGYRGRDERAGGEDGWAPLVRWEQRAPAATSDLASDAGAPTYPADTVGPSLRNMHLNVIRSHPQRAPRAWPCRSWTWASPRPLLVTLLSGTLGTSGHGASGVSDHPGQGHPDLEELESRAPSTPAAGTAFPSPSPAPRLSLHCRLRHEHELFPLHL